MTALCGRRGRRGRRLFGNRKRQGHRGRLGVILIRFSGGATIHNNSARVNGLKRHRSAVYTRNRVRVATIGVLGGGRRRRYATTARNNRQCRLAHLLVISVTQSHFYSLTRDHCTLMKASSGIGAKTHDKSLSRCLVKCYSPSYCSDI